MASRNFCDLCGTEVPKDAVYFSVSGDHVNDSNYPESIYLKNGASMPEFSFSMVCKTCYVGIRNAINDLIYHE